MLIPFDRSFVGIPSPKLAECLVSWVQVRIPVGCAVLPARVVAQGSVALCERKKTPQPHGAKFTVECYFDRAVRFAPDDTVVRVLYATFLAKAGREAAAVVQLERTA